LRVLILIVSALLLSGADAEINIQRNPHDLTENSEKKTGNNQTNGQNAVPLAQHAAPATDSPCSEASSSQTGNHANCADHLSVWLWRIVSSQILFNALLTLATILIAFFNYQVLFLDRPLLVADRPTPGFFTPGERKQAFEQGKMFIVTSANCPFRNVGKSPAIILKIVVKMGLGKDLPLPRRFDDCVETTAVKDAVVPASTASDFYAIYKGNRFSDEEWKQIAEGETKVLLYGQITYKGVLWKKYVMSFGFVYEPPNSGFGPGNAFRFGRKEYNTVS